MVASTSSVGRPLTIVSPAGVVSTTTLYRPIPARLTVCGCPSVGKRVNACTAGAERVAYCTAWGPSRSVIT